jgi:predicted  nucleic acid-binding Zn-ribbon protein
VRRQPRTPGTTCPYCGCDDVDQAFTAPEDIEAAKRHVRWAAAQDMADHLEGIAEDFNRKVGRNSFLPITMSIKRGSLSKPYAWREDLLRGLTCDLCGRSYGVYAIAAFCPDCGGRNIHVHFKREVELIEKQVKFSEEAAAGGDNELAYRILGNAHEDVLTALETYLKTLFLFLIKRRSDPATLEPLSKEARRGNPFQSIDRASALYAQISMDPFNALSSRDKDFLVLHIEKRHVIGHNLGLADEKYLGTVGHEKQGETVRILADDVRRFAQLAHQIVVEGVEETQPEFLPIAQGHEQT